MTADPLYIPDPMATDSATLDRRAASPRRIGDAPKIHSPAEPIARGMGLNQPFFEDKNRAFWILQSIGWGGYFLLRSISGFANSMGWMWLVHTLLLTATGYSLTLLIASLFRRLIQMKPIWTLVLSLAAVMLASTAYSVIETWSVATFLKPTSKPEVIQYLGAILLNTALLAAWAALYYGINYFLLLENEIRQREKLEGQASTRAAGDAALSAQPAFPVQHAELDLDARASEANRARQCDACPALLLPALYAGQRTDREGDAGAGSRDAEALSRDREDALRGSAAAAFPDRIRRRSARGCPPCCSSR